MKITERLTTDIRYSCDVLVVGGGVAGIAAAISAAREGAKVILTERQFMLGGLATAGLVTIYLPLCDGMGNQVSFSLAEELLLLSIKNWHDNEMGYNNWVKDRKSNDQTSPRYEVNFNPQLFAIDAEQLLLREGVKILYGTTAVSATREDKNLSAVIFENKSGRFAITANGFVDASGDSDLAVFSGTPTRVFKQGNVLASWYYDNKNGSYNRNMLGFADIPDSQKTPEQLLNSSKGKRYVGLDGEEISDMVCASHQSILNDVLTRQKDAPHLQPTTIATIPQLRMTRCVKGEYILDDTENGKFFNDSIGLVSDWRKRGPVYEVPFKTLYSSATKNLFFAGRVTSVTDAMWDIMRVIPCCAVTGEAAGLAAAKYDGLLDSNVTEIQEILTKRGVKLHI